MKREIIKSLNFNSIWYWIFSSKLEVEFISWNIIQFKKVPKEIFDLFKSKNYSFDFFKLNIDWNFEQKIIDEKY